MASQDAAWEAEVGVSYINLFYIFNRIFRI